MAQRNGLAMLRPTTPGDGAGDLACWAPIGPTRIAD
jgi:hypothetical protein